MVAATRRELLCALFSALVATRIHAAAPRQARIIWFSDGALPQDEQKRIRDAFVARGRAEGREISLTFVAASDERVPEAVAARPDAIVMVGHDSLRELRRLTRDIPVVFYNLSLDPVALGYVDSLRHPGGNFTGAIVQWDEITSKQWQLLKEMRPAMKRGGLLISKEEVEAQPHHEVELRAWRKAAEGLQIEIRQIVVPKGASASSIASAVQDAGVEALEIQFPGRELIAFVRSTKIPTIGYSFAGVRRGRHLLGISFDWHEGESHAIETTMRILRGERPATIPVYRIRSYALAVNLALARAAGIQVPRSILIQAKEVIE